MLAAAVLAALALPAGAAGAPPSPAELEWGREQAIAYWQVQHPPCGVENVTVAPILSSESATAIWSTCTITFSAEVEWAPYPTGVCLTYVHELGHLVLGPSYFAATDPSDPAHSTDPASVMFGGRERTTQQYEAVERSVGCLPLPAQFQPPAHPALRRNHHRRHVNGRRRTSREVTRRR